MDGAWSEVPDLPPLQDELRLDDLALLAEVTHPLRSTLLHRLREPRSAAELADDLDMPVTRLYHHLNRLAELGLVVVAETRRSGARTERRYRAVARGITLDPRLADTSGADVTRAIATMFDVTKADLRREIDAGVLAPGSLSATTEVSMLTLDLTEADLVAAVAEVRALRERYSAADTGGRDPGRRLRLFIACFPLSD